MKKSTTGEEEPLLQRPPKSNSVRFSQRVKSIGSDDNDAEDTELSAPSSSEKRIIRSSSSLSYVFEKLTRSEREEAVSER